ncbi:putative sterigmatocystin biosynthesis monooxygenase [Lachnellula subtilissima]|uniref:Putative sterigmatocystin biosynthesis monooxygenase n=1 Tax=Lachnellula subtilissima TaxID=602034 RepID=A0A8H8RNL6_9HELO|nr:putative sterigmatocystin biosynthesis monooxygenase [Lachnellula subtilissima]
MSPSSTADLIDNGPVPTIQKPKWIQASKTYEVPKTTLNDPANRPLRVITIGGGVSGIMMAYKIDQGMKNVEHLRCPVSRIHIPLGAYPDWKAFLATSKDILTYLQSVVDKLDLAKYINLNHQVAGCWWDEEKGKWRVKVQIVEPKADWSSVEPLKVLSEFWDEADMIMHATGILNRWDYPDIPGLKDFKGRLVHTAGWPDDFGAEAWNNQDVVVIGSGSSSIQVVPTMQPHVKHMDVYVRTPVWFVQIMNNFGNNHKYTEKEQQFYRDNPKLLVAHIKELENEANGRFDQNIMGSAEQAAWRKMVEERMRSIIKDEKILQGLLPDFPVNCRRMTPGDPYLQAIQEPNVDLRFTGVARITEDGVVGDDGVERKCDVIVCATGFDVSYRPRFPVVGRGGVNLQDKWKDAAEAYFGLACADMPNWLTFIGPNWPIAVGSITGGLDANGDYAIQCLKKLQNEQIKSFCPKQDASDQYNEHTQTWAPLVVWGKGCRTWYKDNDTDRLSGVYAGSTVHYIEMISNVRWEDMDLDYLNKQNKYAFMGIGRHMCQTEEGRAAGMSSSTYYRPDRIDPRILDVTKGMSSGNYSKEGETNKSPTV